jgi:hypothetical protein
MIWCRKRWSGLFLIEPANPTGERVEKGVTTIAGEEAEQGSWASEVA